MSSSRSSWSPIEDPNAAELAYEANELEITEIAAISYNRYQDKMPEKSTYFWPKAVSGLVVYPE